MATALRPIRHEDRLSLVEHLDELRTRLIICVVAFVACFALCLWQDDAILDIVNRPLERSAFKQKEGSKDPFERTAAFQAQVRRSANASAAAFDDLARAADDAAARRGYEQLAAQNRALARSVPPQEARRPVTLGVGEPFVATVRVAAYAALLLALPLLLYQAYAFVLPAFSRHERSVALPLMAMVPVLFIGGVVFAYFLVLPNAIDFLQNFNDDNFDILLQAKDYYRFAITVLAMMGICFQVPVGILALTRLGIVSVAQLRRSRRYTILGIAVVAMLLPGQDPVTMLSLMAPLYVLFEGSILLASLLDRRAARAVDSPEP
jgi:sec-independent protein translocase protein TatC